MLRYFPITGRLVLTDDTQAPPYVIFDTDEPFLCCKPTDVIIDSQEVPARTASSQGVDGTQSVVDIERVYHLAQIDIPGAKVVRGMMRVTWASNPEPADGLWRQASGTHLDILDGVSQTRVPQSDTSGYNRVATMGGYTLYVDDLNNLIMRERIVMRARDPGGPPTTFNRARQAATVHFRLLVGFFLDQDFSPHPAVDLMDTDNFAQTSPSNPISFNLSAGFAFPGRRLIAITYHTSTDSPTSVTIGGVAAANRATIAVGNGRMTVWDATVPTGTTVAVNLTRSGGWGANELVDVELYAAGNVTGAPTVTNNVAGSGTSISQSVSVGANQVAIVGAMCPSSAVSGGDIGFLQMNNVMQRSTRNLGFSTPGGSGVIPRGSGTVNASAFWSGPAGAARGIIAIRFNG